MNKPLFFLFILFSAVLLSSNVIAQSETIITDQISVVNQADKTENTDVDRLGECKNDTALGNGWNCQHSEQFYSKLKANAYGCLCTKHVGNTLMVGFRLISPSDRYAHSKVRRRSDPYNSSVATGPSTLGSYSFVNYTNPNIWQYIEGWDID